MSNKQEMQDIANAAGLGQIHWEHRTALNTGNVFEVGYVGDRELFCKRQSTRGSEFYLCNEFANLPVAS
jgi:hypothetical protein